MQKRERVLPIFYPDNGGGGVGVATRDGDGQAGDSRPLAVNGTCIRPTAARLTELVGNRQVFPGLDKVPDQTGV